MRSNTKDKILSLFTTPLFHQRVNNDGRMEKIEKFYQKAQAITRAHNFSEDDFLNLTDKFWNAHLDNIIPRESAAHILFCTQFNLAVGTVAQASKRNDIYKPILKKMLNYEVSVVFMLTEIGHGWDARNLETTASLQDDGSFILNTPNPGAAKMMPSSRPTAGLPRLAIVMAKLLVKGEDKGVRPFLVSMGNGREMCKGVSSKLIPPLLGHEVLDHAFTSFSNVKLPCSALLLPLEAGEKDINFVSVINRVGVGVMAIPLGVIPMLRASSFIFGNYSARRTITDRKAGKVPILFFRTQHLPLLRALAHLAVLEKMAQWTIERFRDPTTDPKVRHGLAVLSKAVFTQLGQEDIAEMIERCGAQGLFCHNQLVGFEAQLRWSSIAEGDTLAIAIRLATEMVLRRYELPAPTMPDCLLAKHEAGLFDEARTKLQAIGGDHRSISANNLLLPRCRPLVEAIGHRVAYEAAKEAGVDEDLLAIYEVSVINHDLSWYVENGLLTRDEHWENESAALTRAFDRLDGLFEKLDINSVEPYITAPIASDEKWAEFYNSISSLTGNASYEWK